MINNTDRRQINRSVMQDTVQQYENLTSLRNAIDVSLTCQYMVSEDEVIDVERVEHSHNTYLCTPHRTLEAAKNYAGKRVAVLNFANNHSVGGAPFYAGAQEESMCRCSTLYPCLQAMEKVFYVKHQNLFAAHKIGFMGNDDIIYTPLVVVFKTDKRERIIRPVMMPEEEWYKVDVITCAAPELNKMRTIPADYETQMRRRIRRILEVAAREKVEVLILGKWGCGAFANPEEVVARLFYEELEHYEIGTVEFALGGDEPDSPFNTYSPQPSKTEAINILKALSESTTGFPSELERRRFGRALGLGGPLGDKNFNE